ncbi:MAG: hypothetical protein A3F72_03985 [Bacteroidetes bacterium RIFCSPLOWO2_12_FULL_35_15]|nr:MAG: hypothetical protein A3F72_03985 [Bacteroidetes bacterium RIFCSPLOWO2_12_FULL_35_15]
MSIIGNTANLFLAEERRVFRKVALNNRVQLSPQSFSFVRYLQSIGKKRRVRKKQIDFLKHIYISTCIRLLRRKKNKNCTTYA